ncbi:MAG: DUF4412 domain-containing protein [Elusimicrobiota bacterium]
MRMVAFIYMLILCFQFSYAGVWVKYRSNYQTENSKEKIYGENYYKKNMYRSEMKVPVEDGGEKKKESVITIMRLDKKVIWTVIPEQKGYIEFTFDDMRKAYEQGKDLVPSGKELEVSNMSFKKIGEGEKIASFPTIKYQIKDKLYSGYVWLCEDKKLYEAIEFFKNMVSNIEETKIKGMPVYDAFVLKQNLESKEAKCEYEVVDVKNKEFSQDLFEIPKDYKLLDTKIWERYKNSFSVRSIMQMMVENMKEELKKQAQEKAKDEIEQGAKKAIKGLIKF